MRLGDILARNEDAIEGIENDGLGNSNPINKTSAVYLDSAIY